MSGERESCACVLHTLPVVYAHADAHVSTHCQWCVRLKDGYTLFSADSFIAQSGLCLEADLPCSKLNPAVYVVSVAELGKLSGVVAILRFPLPDVESGSQPDEDADEEENPAINGD